jgi:hypothetical protein
MRRYPVVRWLDILVVSTGTAVYAAIIAAVVGVVGGALVLGGAVVLDWADKRWPARGSRAACEAEMRRVTNGARGCANPEEHWH